MKKKLILMCVLVQSVIFVHGGGVVETFKKATGVNLGPAGEQLFVDVVQEKKNQLQKLQEERNERQIAKEKSSMDRKGHLEEIQNKIDALERSLHYYTHNKYLNKQLFLTKEMHQLVKDTQRSEDDLDALLTSLMNEVSQFVEDPECKKFKMERHLETLSYYSFDDLQNIHVMIVNQERLVAQLAEQEKNTQVEQESRRRMLKIIEEDHAKRLEDLQNFAERHTKSDQYETLTVEQQEKQLIATEEHLFRDKKDLYELRIQESKYALDLIQLRLFIERVHLNILTQHLKSIKASIHVTEADLIQARELLNGYKKGYFTRRERYQKDRDRLANEQKMKERYRDLYARENGVSLGRDLDEWSRDPKQTVASYLSIVTLGTLNAEVQWLAKERDLLETQRALEDEKFTYIVTQTNAKEAYYKISVHKFSTAEDISQAIKQFETQKVDASSNLAISKERISTIADLLNQQKKILDNINSWRERSFKQKEQLFKGHVAEYTRILELLNSAEEFIKKRIDALGKLTGVYSGIISEVNGTLRLVQFILAELQSTSIWYRPEYAITWQGIKNVWPDIHAFFNDIKGYVMRLDVVTIKDRVYNFIFTPLALLILFLKILFLFFLLFNFKHVISRLRDFLSVYVERTQNGAVRTISVSTRLLVNFVYEHFSFIGLWIAGIIVFMFWLSDPYLYALFCILSIPFLLFIINRLIRYFIAYNMQYDNVMVSSDFQKRFIVVISVLMYATTSIFFFRQAFMRVSYYSSELPTILLAVNFIIFQIALISLITKDQILSIIPQKTEAWLWVREQVGYYFYFILLFFITIIVMSNPYVGFGRLVIYTLSGLLYTVILVKLFLGLYRWSKKAAFDVFFIEDEEVVRERFDHARTWFGLCIISSFFAITFVGCLVVAKIWGWGIALKDISGLLYKPILLESTAYPVTILSMVQIIAFIGVGLIAAYSVNRFVLDKIFDLLVVDPGVQYTTTRFIQYFIMIIFIFFGFKNVGLGDLVGYLIGALAIGIGWYVREPIGDFIAYFIILVQRPLKIGDFIKLDNETFGFVRKITPRAVIIRKKNSTTIVIPNSQIINKTVTNWNYVRNFVAFDDIYIVIAYKEDPQKVKDLLLIAVNSHANVLRNPKPIIRLEDLTEYGYLFIIRGFISSAFTQDMWDIASDVRFSIVKILKDNNIEIAEYMKTFRSGHVNRLAGQDRNNM